MHLIPKTILTRHYHSQLPLYRVAHILNLDSMYLVDGLVFSYIESVFKKIDNQ